MPQLRCPRCATVVAVPEGASPVCTNCGYGAEGPQAVPPAPAAGAWGQPAAAPPQGQAPYAQHAAQGYGAPPPYPPGGYGNPYASPNPPGHGLVIAAWICGPLGLLHPFIGIAGIICAAIAKSKGHPRATAPLIVAIACSAFWVVIAMLFFGLIAGMMGGF